MRDGRRLENLAIVVGKIDAPQLEVREVGQFFVRVEPDRRQLTVLSEGSFLQREETSHACS